MHLISVKKRRVVRASVEALRTMLRAASIDSLDEAVSLVVYYIEQNKPFEPTLNKLLEPIDDDPAFNQRLAMVRAEAGL